MTATEPARLVLASTSPYRRELLARLRLPFEALAPGTDESAVAGETPRAHALRLARAKARAVAANRPGAVVIGSDQVAERDGHTLGKPGDRAGAVAQLRAASGRTLLFHTAVCVVAPGTVQEFVDRTRVRFRPLRDHEIERYLDLDRPWDCAGSFKAERAGIALFEAIRSDDPTALVGLPLIRLAAVLRGLGFPLP